MLGFGQVEAFRRRKAELLERSEHHRRTLLTEAKVLEQAAGWVDLGMKVAGRARSAWGLMAKLLSSWLSPRKESSGVMPTLVKALSFIGPILAVWKTRR